jgi:hypothetical protein
MELSMFSSIAEKLLFDENGVAAGIVRSGVARVELAPDSGAGVRE